MFTAAMFTIDRTWKQPRCPSTDEWIRKLWYTMGYYSAIKRNAFESVLIRWMSPEPIIQSELSQKEKDKYHILTYIYMGSIKMVLMNLFAGQWWKCQHRDGLVDTGEEGEGEVWRE